MRPLVAATVLFLTACTPAPVAAPAPVALTVAAAPPAVVQRAAQRLAVDGFTVRTSDAAGGVLIATLARQGRGAWGPYIACRFSESAGAHLLGGVVLTVHVAAQSAASGGSAVYLTTTAENSADGPLGPYHSTTDCASTGAIERDLAAAVSAGAP